MNRDSHTAIRILLWLTAAYHFVAGIAATFAQERALTLGSFLFGMSITLTPEVSLLVRYLGVFGITLAVLAAYAALDPVANRKIVVGTLWKAEKPEYLDRWQGLVESLRAEEEPGGVG